MSKILHLTNTPLAGAPWSLSNYLNKYTEMTSQVILTRSSTVKAGEFSTDLISFTDKPEDYKYYESLINSADLIHIHNNISPEFLGVIAQSNFKGKFIYQIHSPLRERSAYIDLSKSIPVDFSKKIAVAHFHPRQYPDFELVPNLLRYEVGENYNFSEDLQSKKDLDLIYSPSNRVRNMRWSSKTSLDFENGMRRLWKTPGINVHSVSDLTPGLVWEIRKSCDITVDEVISGSFHLVSLEGLALGHAVINNADDLSIMYLMSSINTTEIPPFVKCDQYNFVEVIKELINDRKRLLQVKKNSKEYFFEHMRQEKLVSFYVKKYEETF